MLPAQQWVTSISVGSLYLCFKWVFETCYVGPKTINQHTGGLVQLRGDVPARKVGKGGR